MCNFTKTYNAKYYRNFPFTALSYSVIVIFYTSRCYYKFQPLLRITVVSSIDIVHIILHLILCIFPTGKVHFFPIFCIFLTGKVHWTKLDIPPQWPWPCLCVLSSETATKISPDHSHYLHQYIQDQFTGNRFYLWSLLSSYFSDWKTAS